MATLIKMLKPYSLITQALNSLSTYPQVWNGRVRYVFGSPLVAEDMRLVHAEVADACFMLCSKVILCRGCLFNNVKLNPHGQVASPPTLACSLALLTDYVTTHHTVLCRRPSRGRRLSTSIARVSYSRS